MIRFFVAPEELSGQTARLTGENARHAKVLRLKQGEEVLLCDGGGLYVNASAGCRISINEKQAINLSVGYAIEKLQFETFDSFINHTSMDYTRYTTLYDTEAVTIKLGFFVHE